MTSHSNLNFRVENLSLSEEYSLFEKAREGDKKSLDRLLVNNMHIARLIAMKYKFYGIPVEDLFQEACVGMMRAVNSFDTSFGIKFSSHASIYMKNRVVEHVLDNLKMVKYCTTKKKKRLFFNYKRMIKEGYSHEEISKIFDIDEFDVDMMAAYITGTDVSIEWEEDGEDGSYKVDVFVSSDNVLENVAMIKDQDDTQLLNSMMSCLNEREKTIVVNHWVASDKKSLQEIGSMLNLSAERVRQIEVQAFAKMRDYHTNVLGR